MQAVTIRISHSSNENLKTCLFAERQERGVILIVPACSDLVDVGYEIQEGEALRPTVREKGKPSIMVL